MKFAKLLVFCVLVLAPFTVGLSEISTNLYASKEYDQNNKLVALTYVSEFGEPTVAEDLGYVTARYSYKGNRRVSTAFYDLDGNLIEVGTPVKQQ